MAYEPLGGEFLVNTSTSGDQFISEVTALVGGGYVICWSDPNGDGSGYSVKAQLIGSDGTLIGGEILVNSATLADQKIPTVAALDNGGFAISWYDYSNQTGDSSGSGVIVRLYGSDGTAVTSEILVNTTTTNDQAEPYVAGLAGGGFVVTWIDYSNEGGDTSVSAVRAQVFASDGTAVGGEILVNTETNDYQIQPQISGLENGNFVITWTDRSGVGGDGSNFGVKAQLFAPDGTKIGGEFLVNTELPNEQTDPTVTGLVGGGFVITWNDHSGLGGDSSGWGIRAQLYDASGTPIGGEFVVNTVTFDEQQGPTVAALPDGGFVISWMDYAGTFGGAGGGIKAQIFAADGTPVGGEFTVNAIDDNRQLYPDIAAQADGSFLITWISNGAGGDGDGYGIKAQIYAPESTGEPAIAQDDSFATDELTAISGDLFADNGAGADSDADGPPLSIAAVNGSAANVGSQITLASGALLTVNADGTFAYDPNGAFEYTPFANSGASNMVSSDSFTYALADGGTATVTLSITGVDNDDLIIGTSDHDNLNGGNGDDRLVAGGGDWDSIYGGAGTDTVVLSGNRADYEFHLSSPSIYVTNLIDGTHTNFYGVERFEFADQTLELSELEPFVRTGTANNDYLYGTYASDHFLGGGGDDEIQGYDGNDILDGGAGNDIILGNEGTDTLLGGSGNDYLSGENGNIGLGGSPSFGSFYNDGAADHIDGGDGIDTAQFDYHGTNMAITADFSDPSVMQTLPDGSTIVNVEALQAWLGNGDDNLILGSGNDTILSEGGNDVLSGGGGGDRLYGGAGTDHLSGGDGNDGLYGGAGDDIMLGGDGDDEIQDIEGNNIIDGGEGMDSTYLDFSSSPTGVTFELTGDQTVEQANGTLTLISIEAANINGGAFADHITGGSGADWIAGGAGNNSLFGGGGNDRLWGGNDDDLIEGGDGADQLQGYGGNDSLYGGAGDDWLDGGTGNDLIDGGEGIDRTTLNVYSAAAGVSFSLSDNPTIVTSVGTETLVSIEGMDFYGTQFADTVTGGEAVDYLRGQAGNDVLSGAGGNDTLYGDAGNDQLYGGDGDDYLEGGAGTNTLDGGDGTDRTYIDFYGFTGGVTFALTSNVTVTDYFGTHTLISIERAQIFGTNYADTITGGSGADTISGGDGNDIIYGAGGNDSLSGGVGNDLLYGGDGDDEFGDYYGDDTFDGGAGLDRVSLQFWNSTSSVTVSLADDPTLATASGTKTLVSIEGAYVSGSQFDDTVTGGDAVDQFYGQDGNDTLSGLGGNDYLDGGRGNDTLIGGAGNDVLRGNDESTLAVYYGPRSNYHVTQSADGSVTVTDTTGAEGVDTLWSITSLQFSDGTVAVADALEASAPADAQNDEFTTNELTLVTGNVFADNGFGADSDPDGPALTIAEVNGSAANVGVEITLPSGAKLTVNADGSFSYDPNGAFEQTPTYGSGAFNTPSADSFSYTLAGGDTATVVLTINGVDNDDTIIGSEDNNRLIAGDGNDLVFGLGGGDYITGGLGDDMIFGDDGVDRAGWYQVNEALGGATVSLQLQGQAQDTGSQGWDTLFDIENLSGTPFADSLTGDDNDNWLWGSPATIIGIGVSTTNNDILDGAGGNDLLTVGIGNHTVIGGDGVDTLRFTENGSPEPGISLLLWEGAAQNTGAGSWTLSGIENASAGVGDDYVEGTGAGNVIAGDLGADQIFGLGGSDTLIGDGFINVDPNNVITTVLDQGAAGGNDQLFGGGGDDTLYGGGGNDALRGGAGNDAIYGGYGDDLIIGGFGDDLIDGGEGYDRAGNYHTDETLGGVAIDLNITGAQDTGSQGWDTFTGIEYLSGTPFADVLIGDANDNVLWGSVAMIDPGTNWVSTTNNDTLDGGEGGDLLYAGIGNHTLIGGGGNDTVGFTENWGDDPAIRISLALQGIAQDTGQGLWTLSGIENLSGGNDDDELTGDGNANILAGSYGNDALSGGGGDDSLYGDGAIDSGAPSSGPPTLFPDVGADGNDTLDGGDGDDQLYGGGGNDILVGGAGADLLDGGDGRDLANYGPGSGPVTVDLGAGTATRADGNDSLIGIEDVLGSGEDDLLVGDGDYNVLNGGGGNDVINGAGGDDTLMGGDGNDQLYGNSGNDQLIGGLGDDVIDGGADRDVADYQYAPGGVTALLYGGGFGEAFGADGYDQLYNIEDLNGSAFNDILYGDEAANMVVGNDGHDDVRGGDGNDNILGGAGDDLLYGNGGDDYLDGGDGYDRVGYFSGATAGVTVDLTLQGVAQDTGQGMDVLVNIENVSGTQFGDTLTGDDNDNVIWGSAATLSGVVSTENNDTLSGGGGNDLLIAGIGNHAIDGGEGIDTFRFTENGVPETGITLSLLLAGQAQASGNGSWTLTGIENLSGGIGGDNLTGDGNANVLAGDLGDDVLSGGAGDDTLYGDGQVMWDDHGTGRSGPAITTADATSEYVGGVSGNDILEGGLGDDLIDGGGGSDTASYEHASGAVNVNLGSGFASGADGNDTLANIENAIGSEFNDTLNGSGGNNILEGLGGNDVIQGQGGNDTIHGGDGDDTLRGDANELSLTVTGDDVIHGDDGNDNLRGGLGDDQLFGGANNDLLRGNGGVDYFDGGADDGEGFNGIGDRISFFDQRATQGVIADLRTGVISNDGFGNVETMVGIESLGGDTAYSDTFHGDDNRNALIGGLGDNLFGHGGDDMIQTGAAATIVDGGSGTDDLILITGVGGLIPDSNGDGLAEFTTEMESGWTIDLQLGIAIDGYGNSGALAGIENVLGSGLGDSITGDSSTNVLFGGFGNDTLDGGDGDDELWGGDGSDTASFTSATGGVSAGLYDDDFGEAFGASGYDQLHEIENLTGSAFNDQLAGNNFANVIEGGDGNDGLRGNDGDDTLLGGAGNDFLNGGLGNDLIDGGEGFDRAAFYEDAGPGGVTVDLNLQGQAQDTGQGMDTLIGVENVSGSVYGDTLIGDDGDNQLWGSASTLTNGTIVSTNNDTLSGGGGNDLLVVGIGNHVIDGGSGIDTFRFTENGAAETGITLSLLLAGEAQASGNGSWTLTNIENLSGSISDDDLTGDGNANVLAGDAGNDALAGGGGNDILYGDGAILVNAPGSGPIETFTDVAALGGVSGDDTLDGGDGDDQLWGGGGSDTASYASAGGDVTALLYDGGFGEAFGAAGYDQLHDIENVSGSAFNDILYANSLDNIVSGGDGHDDVRGGAGNDQVLGDAGDDLLYGNAGDDYLDGGDGYDRAGFFSGAVTGVTVDLNLQGVAQDTGQGMDTLVNIENLSGTQFADTLIGDNNDNFLWGSAATVSGVVSPDNNDTLIGNGGNDLLIGGIGNHVIDGGTGVDTFWYTENGVPETGITLSLALQGAAQDSGNGSWVLTNIENLSGSISSDNLSGDANDNALAGDLGNDTLSGGSGNDTLYGDGQISWDAHGITGRSGPITTYTDATGNYVGAVAGNDVLEGGLGDDWIDGGGGSDTASYANASGGVQVFLSNNTSGNGSASGADGDDLLFSVENLTGSAFADNLTGSAAANVLIGGGGNDFLQARGGDDSVYGGDGNDYLGGGTGDDLLDGGAGWDRASFSNGASGPVHVDLRIQGVAQDTGLGMDTLIGIENANGTAFADTFIGNDGDNWLWGGNDSAGTGDTIDGQGGDDLIEDGMGDHNLDGGTGIDTFSFNPFTVPTSATISLALQGAAQDTGAGIMTLNGFENLSGSSFSDTLIGDGNANVLAGGEAGDMLIGGAGNDTLYGDGAVGTDGSPSGPITVFADLGQLGGIDGDDILEGGLGDDVIDGGGGTDTANYANASGGVTVNLATGTSSGADGNDTLAGIENATGGAFNDTLTGDGVANVLAGGDGHDALSGQDGNDSLQAGDGNDSLTGGAGDDILDGGAGFDRANYNVGATAGVTVNLSLTGAQSTGQGSDTLLGIEHLVGTTFNDVLTGSDGDNWIWGGSLGTGVTGNDTISGGNGNDLIEVGAGNHTLNGGGGTSDTLSFWAGGTDVTSTGVAFNLATTSAQNTRQGSTSATGFENLSGSRYGDALTGNTQNNILAGNTGNDTLNGGIGSDTLYGDGGYTTFTAGGLATGPIRLVADVTTEFGGVAGNDTLNGGDGDDFLYGGGGNDVMKGDKDNDTLYGGAGNDNLVGGQGNDLYVIEANSGADTISGFTHVDKIVFDTSSGVTSFGQLTLSQVGGTNTLVTWGNGNSILIEGLKPKDITAADFQFPAPASLASFSTQEDQRVLAGSTGDTMVLAAIAASGLLVTTSVTPMLASSGTSDDYQSSLEGSTQSGFVELSSNSEQVRSFSVDEAYGLATETAGSFASHSTGSFDRQLAPTSQDSQASAPAELLEATQLAAPSLPAVSGAMATGVSLPSGTELALAAAHGSGLSGAADAVATSANANAQLLALLDGIVFDGPASIDALLDALPGGNDPMPSLANLAHVGADQSAWAANSYGSNLLLDVGQEMATHHDAVGMA